mgnify:CR=1 FL=1
MKHLPRVFSLFAIVGFFLPWLDFGPRITEIENSMKKRIEMTESSTRGLAEALLESTKEELETVKQLNGASGLTLALSIVFETAKALFLVPFLFVLAALGNKRIPYLICSLLSGALIYFCAPIHGGIKYEYGLILVILGLAGCFLTALFLGKKEAVPATAA